MSYNNPNSSVMMVMRSSSWSLPRRLYTMTLVLLLLFTLQQQCVECRYLPTRSHGDNLDKLRELMLQILESSNEDQAHQLPPNEANGNTAGGSRAALVNKLSDAAAWENFADSLQDARKYAPRRGGGLYDNGRYY